MCNTFAHDQWKNVQFYDQHVALCIFIVGHRVLLHIRNCGET